MVTTEAGRLQDDSGKQGSVSRVTGECGTHTGQAQWPHHPNQSNLAIRIVTAKATVAGETLHPGKVLRSEYQCRVEVCREEEAPTAPLHGASAPRFRTTEGQERRAVNHLHQGEHSFLCSGCPGGQGLAQMALLGLGHPRVSLLSW